CLRQINPGMVSIMRASRFPALLFSACLLSACSEQDKEIQATVNAAAPAVTDIGAQAEVSAQALHRLFDDYFENYLELNPTFATFIGDNRFNDAFANDISPGWREVAMVLEQDALQRLDA